MGRLAGFSYREVIKQLKLHGFTFYRQATASHEIWFNKQNKRYTTVPHHPGDIPEGTSRAILRQANISPKVFLKQ